MLTSPLRGRTVVVLHAHPDDEAIFTGTTMRRLADEGARVVLVTATLGELGEVLVPLQRDETVAQRRRAELEQAAALLGVSRLVLLGKRDSGLPGSDDNARPGALACADVERVAQSVARIANAESAEAIIGYDSHGIYGHPDHVAVHEIGRRAAHWLGVTSYEATVDRDYLRPERPHLLHAAAEAAGLPFGVAADDVTLMVDATPAELDVKQLAIRTHASQVHSDAVPGETFEAAYGREWYLRDGQPGVLDELSQLSMSASMV